MAHELETINGQTAFVTARVPAWHQLGTVTDDCMTAEDVMAKAFLGGWKVRKIDLQGVETTPDSVSIIECPDRRMTVRNPGDEGPETDARRQRAPSREQLPGFEHRTLRVAVERDEVIPGPNRIEAELVDEGDGVAELGPRGVLGREVDAPVRTRASGYARFPVAANRSARSSASSMAVTPMRSSSSLTTSGGATKSMFQRQKT